MVAKIVEMNLKSKKKKSFASLKIKTKRSWRFMKTLLRDKQKKYDHFTIMGNFDVNVFDTS